MMVLSHCHQQESAVKKFIDQFTSRINGVISCFDRILFKGYLPLGWPGAMEGLLARERLKIKGFQELRNEALRPDQGPCRNARPAGRAAVPVPQGAASAKRTIPDFSLRKYNETACFCVTRVG